MHGSEASHTSSLHPPTPTYTTFQALYNAVSARSCRVCLRCPPQWRTRRGRHQAKSNLAQRGRYGQRNAFQCRLCLTRCCSRSLGRKAIIKVLKLRKRRRSRPLDATPRKADANSLRMNARLVSNARGIRQTMRLTSIYLSSDYGDVPSKGLLPSTTRLRAPRDRLE